jgi:trimethylamine--corrinoid protein Co-methyltransferase
VFSLWGAIQGGGNLMMHAAGWLEGGLRCSYEKTILDIDLLQMVAEFLTPLDLSEDALGVEAIRAVGPGGHFFGTPHTQERYKTAFYSPIISDWRNYETWAEAGSPTAIEKANRIWKERLASYEEPYMDPAIREELNAFVDKRKAEAARRRILIFSVRNRVRSWCSTLPVLPDISPQGRWQRRYDRPISHGGDVSRFTESNINQP